MKVLIAICASRDWVEKDFMTQFATWQIPEGVQVKFGWFQQFTAAERHNVAMNEALYNYDRILFMDTDQYYPPDYFTRMLAHNEPLVSALNTSRYYPYESTTYKLTRMEEKYGIDVPVFEAVKPPPDKRVFECDITGTGSLMVDVEVLDKIERPYFKDVFDPEGCLRLIPDDFYFGWLLYKAGIKVTVDQGIVVKHAVKTIVSPYNAHFLRQAWEAGNSGFGYWKDGKQ